MRSAEYIYRELLYMALEKKLYQTTQKALAQQLKLSLSTVHNSLKPLRRMGSVEVRLRSLRIVDPLKILYHWANVRNLEKDIIYQTHVNKPVLQIEAEMPDTIVFGAYTAYRLHFKDAPADYSEVYVYGDTAEITEIKRRFPFQQGAANLFVLALNGTARYGKKTTFAQTFVDLWNLKEWYAKEYLLALERKIREII